MKQETLYFSRIINNERIFAKVLISGYTYFIDCDDYEPFAGCKSMTESESSELLMAHDFMPYFEDEF